MLSILGERERSHDPTIFGTFHVVVARHEPGQAFLSFLDGFSSMSVPITLLLKGTMPRQALLSTLPGAMAAGTLSLQGMTSLQAAG